MAENVQQSVEVPVGLELFGSLVTEMNPSDLPEGISPDNQDVVYLPGGVGSRPCMNSWLDGLLPAGVTITYEKTFITPAGASLNMILCSNGQMLVQDMANPSVVNSIGNITPGSYANSVSAFGKELFTFHDGAHGTDIPKIFDGQYFDRATQDGPAAPPLLSNLSLLSSQMLPSPNTLTRNLNTVTANTATPHNLQIGYQAQISNLPDSNSTTVNQTMSGGPSLPLPPGVDWEWNGNQFRTLFEPVTTGLGDMTTQGFGFTIPSGATILGIVVSAFLVSENHNTGALSQVALWNNGAQLGTAKTPGTPFTTTDTQQAYGSAGDSWGAALTPAIVNNPTFGFSMAVNQPNNDRLFIGEAFTVTVYYTISGPGTVAFIQSIVINNETNSGLALVTTTEPHGLAPEEFVSIVGVEPGVVANISSAQWSAGTTTITTAASHNLNPGSVVQIGSVETATGGTAFSFNGTFVVVTVPSPNQITYNQVPITATDPDVINATNNTGNIVISWPIPDTPTPSYFQVQSAPTPTTFMVPVNYSDGTWTTGTVGFAWEGIFYVTRVISPTQFQYQQYGPNGATSGVGTVTPFGQAAPGIHTAVCLFQTRSGLITAPSPVSLQFTANGGQYVVVDNIPIGPPNVIARIIAFTGADGDNYFYIPYPNQINGITVSTGTVIYDNSTTSATFDFSDNTLFASLAIDIPGNNLFELRTLGPCLGILSYASRAAWYGYRNSIQNFLNLRFDGGYNDITLPLGWGVITSGGILSTNNTKWGFSWHITGDGSINKVGQISQSAYVDSYNAPILSPSTIYAVNFWASLVSSIGGIGGQLVIALYSPSLGPIAFANVLVNQLTANGDWFTLNFSGPTNAQIPADTLLTVYGQALGAGTVVSIDEIEIFPTKLPYTPTFEFSYVNFPEQLDNLTGILGATDDDTPLQTFFIYRNSLLFLSQAGLHETNDIAGLEPQNWKVRQISDHCGACSPRACDTGENFSVWVTSPSAQPPVGRGLYLYTGGAVFKLSQEIQPDFDAMNQDAQQCIWVKNDSTTRRIYVGAPMGGATAPSRIYVLDYRELDTASDLASRGPIHISFSGKMVCSDLSRKWTRWNVTANCGQIMKVPGIGTQFSVGSGNGETPGTLPGFANCYWFDPTLLTDDDYGQVVPYYTTYFFVNHEAEQALQVGLHRKLYKRYATSITGVGLLSLTPYANSLSNPWPSPPNWPLSANSDFDLGDGLNVSTERCAFKLGSIPASGSDNKFTLAKLIITLMQEPVSPIRFGAV